MYLIHCLCLHFLIFTSSLLDIFWAGRIFFSFSFFVMLSKQKPSKLPNIDTINSLLNALRLKKIIKFLLLFFHFAPLCSVLLDFFCHSPWIHIKVFIVFFKGRSWKAEIWWFQTISWWACFIKRPILAIRPKVPIWIKPWFSNFYRLASWDCALSSTFAT